MNIGKTYQYETEDTKRDVFDHFPSTLLQKNLRIAVLSFLIQGQIF